MRVTQVACDQCNKVLSGIVGTAHVTDDYLTIKGRITLHHYNAATKQHDYTHATMDAYEENMFCSVDCLEQFVARRIKERKEAAGKERVDRALKDFRFPASEPWRG